MRLAVSQDGLPACAARTAMRRWFIALGASVLFTLTGHAADQDEPSGVTPMQWALLNQLYQHEEELGFRLSKVHRSWTAARELLREQLPWLTKFNHDIELAAIRFEQ